MLASFDLGGSVLAGDFGGSEWGGVDFFRESDVPFSLPFFLAFTGGWVVSMRSMSGDQTFEFLATHIQNDALILISPNFLAEANARLLQNPNLLREVVTDLEQYPLAPTSIVNRSQYQPLEEITLARPEYFSSLVECQDSMFSSHGQVSSTMMTRFEVLE